MKKLIAIAFVATFAVALVACGGGKTEEAAAQDTVSTVTPPVDTTTTPVDTTKTDTTAAQ